MFPGERPWGRLWGIPRGRFKFLSRHFMGIDVNLTREREDAVPDMERLDKNGKETDIQGAAFPS